MSTNIEFEYKKATQAINYIAEKAGKNNVVNKMKAIKLIWLADRYHIRKYGRPIVGDEYMALWYGPVGSLVKDVSEENEFWSPVYLTYSRNYLQRVNIYENKSIKKTDQDVFSDTDLEALDFAIKNFGGMTQFQLAELSHKYPEWKKFESLLAKKISKSEKMSYLDFFEDPANFPEDKFATKNKDEIEASKEIFLEESQAANERG